MKLFRLMSTIFLWLNFEACLSSPAINTTEYLSAFKYDGQSGYEDTTTTVPFVSEKTGGIGAHADQNTDRRDVHHETHSYQINGEQPTLYTVQLSPQHNQRQLKHDDLQIVYDYKCPKQHYIHPCDCLELDKRAEMLEGSGEMEDVAADATPTVEMIEEEPIHPDHIETVAFCKNIRNVQVLTEAIRGFQGHRINYFVLDGCKLPPFPNNLFKGINVVWMEILNSTLQFHDNFFSMKSCP